MLLLLLICTAGAARAARSRSLQQQGSPGVGSARSRSGQGQEPPDKTRRLVLSPAKGAQGRHSISDTTNGRCKTSSNGKETQGTASGSTNRILDHITQEGQGSGQRCQHRPEREREARSEVPPGATRPNQDPRGARITRGLHSLLKPKARPGS